MEHENAALGLPGHSQYDLDMVTADNDFDLEFDGTAALGHAAGSLPPADFQYHPGAQRPRVHPRSTFLPRVPAQKGPQQPHKGAVPLPRLVPGMPSGSSKALPRAKHVMHQFGQAAHRLRAMDERITGIEKLSTQLAEMSRRLSLVEQRLSEVQAGLKTAEEGHEEISEMVKASLSFLNDLNGDESIGEHSIAYE